MKPEPKKENTLINAIQKLHPNKFVPLDKMAEDFANCLKSSARFELVDAPPPRPHVGRVIVDWVLQVGHSYENAVRPAVERILKFDEAVTVSGFINLLQNNNLYRIIKWKESNKIDLLRSAGFFRDQNVDTFQEAYDWSESEENRDRLLAKNSGLGRQKGSVFSVGDKTADYFRVLVGHWDAVAVDRGMKKLLADCGILPRYSKKYSYKCKRSIVQLAALKLGCRPIDLDRSVYRDYARQ